MRKVIRRSFVVLATMAAAVTSSLAVAGPAQAYPDAFEWEIVKIRTDSCITLQPTQVDTGSGNGYCYVGGTHFTKDDDGVGLRLQASLSGERLFKIEFHPYGEVFKVCDTENDGDSVHAKLQYQAGGQWFSMPLVSPPGTSDDIECTRKNYSFAEGTHMKVVIYDDTAMNDYIGAVWELRA